METASYDEEIAAVQDDFLLSSMKLQRNVLQYLMQMIMEAQQLRFYELQKY
jgi:hypothetical protein